MTRLGSTSAGPGCQWQGWPQSLLLPGLDYLIAFARPDGLGGLTCWVFSLEPTEVRECPLEAKGVRCVRKSSLRAAEAASALRSPRTASGGSDRSRRFPPEPCLHLSCTRR